MAPIELKTMADDDVSASVTMQAKKEIVHTRSCNKREVCSCLLRLESKFFQKNLRAKKSGHQAIVKRARVQIVSNVCELGMEIKQFIAEFLKPIDVANLSMVNKAFNAEMEQIAEYGTKVFMSDEARAAMLLKVSKRENQTWSEFMHKQMNAVYKIFVYYTGYKTGKMRVDFPYWAFGLVEIDPNDPCKVIMPNTWKFHDHQPWVKKKGNGKDGEWILRDPYKYEKLSNKFKEQVSEWANKLRPGSMLTVGYKNLGATEPAWWEAQVWYVWRANGRNNPATVLDAENNTHLTVAPDDLAEHFKNNPLHVIDVCSTPGSVCRRCERRGLTFYECHVTQGHPMV